MAKRFQAPPTAGQERKPLITVASALAGKGKTGQTAELLEVNEEFAVVKLRFTEPKLSESGKSYGCGFGTVNAGAMKINVLAYIPLGKDKAKATRAGWQQDDQRQGAEDFYRSGE